MQLVDDARFPRHMLALRAHDVRGLVCSEVSFAASCGAPDLTFEPLRRVVRCAFPNAIGRLRGLGAGDFGAG